MRTSIPPHAPPAGHRRAERIIMIYTRFGSDVTIIGRNMSGDYVRIEYHDGRIRETYPHELRADGGALEIERAIKAAPIVVED
jgi:hypothetical protein